MCFVGAVPGGLIIGVDQSAAGERQIDGAFLAGGLGLRERGPRDCDDALAASRAICGHGASFLGLIRRLAASCFDGKPDQPASIPHGGGAARPSAPCPSRCAAARRRRCTRRGCLKRARWPSAASTAASSPVGRVHHRDHRLRRDRDAGTPITALSPTPGSASIASSISLGIDVEPAGDDQVLGAADDRDAAVGVHRRDVAGDEPAVRGDLLGGLLGHRANSPRTRSARDLEHADLAAELAARRRCAPRRRAAA